MQDWCTVRVYRTIGSEIVLDAPDAILGDVGHVESHFFLFGDNFCVHARQVHGLRPTYHRLRNHFGRTRWNSYVTWVMWNLTSFCLGTVLVLVQDRCMACARCTIGSEIVLDAPDGTTV